MATPVNGQPRGRWRRRAFAALVAGTLALVAILTWNLLVANGMDALEYPIFVLSTILAVPIVTSFWLAVAGFLAEWHREIPTLRIDGNGGPRLVTAVVMPIHNEDPHRVTAALRATIESVAATGHLAAFRFFLLSDSTDPRRWIDEEIATSALRSQLPDPECLVYRHRPRNTDRKVGNIGDFCRRWGDRFECMIVLDADSVMSGRTLVHLARLMEQHPNVGILQVPPLPVNGTSLFTRGQQFAASAYGKTWAAGLAWLQTNLGNYYGHNAIVRIRPFVQNCELPRLPGREPLGGAILSHDFVEAALMCRAGHATHLLPDLDGSFEESPPTLIDHVNRDRRWCQGNLQHARLLGMRGLHAMSRTHLVLGILSYAAAPLWLLLMLAWTAQAVTAHFVPHEYFASSSLFPVFETSIANQALLLLTVILSLLFVPRVLAIVARLRDADERRAYGGTFRMLRSFVAECALSMLLAPTLMIEHTRAVVGILCGRTTTWNAQSRGEGRIRLRDAVRRFLPIGIAGVVWTVLLWWTSRETLWWMLPALVGMVSSVPIAMVTGSAALGRRARAKGVLLTPAETAPEPVLARYRDLLRCHVTGAPSTTSALERVLADDELRRLHASFCIDRTSDDPLEEHALEGLVMKCRLQGPGALTDAEQRALLNAPEALESLAAAPRNRGAATVRR